MAYEYGISRNTFCNWLKSAGIKLPGGLISPIHQEWIYEVFGNPLQQVEKPKLQPNSSESLAGLPIQNRNSFGK